MSRRGDVHNLAIEEHPDADRKTGRPWLLVHTPAESAMLMTFAYGTTQATEVAEGAVPLDVRWRRLSGPITESRFFTVRLRSESPEAAGERVGHARDHGVAIGAALSADLGIGTGVGTGAVGTIQRGQVIGLHSLVRERIGAAWAIVVTRPEYAALRRYQLLVPLYRADDVDLMAGEITSSAPWVRSLPGEPERVVIAVPALFSECESGPRLPGGIVGVTRARADPGSMAEIDAALARYFGL